MESVYSSELPLRPRLLEGDNSYLGLTSKFFNEIGFNNSKIHQDFLRSEFNYDINEAIDNESIRIKIFSKLCKCRYYELTKWAARRLNITKKDIYEPLYKAFKYNNFINIKWLMTEFDVKRDDIEEEFLEKIIPCLHTRSLRWLVEKFNIQPIADEQDKKYSDFGEKVIKYAHSNGKIKMLIFLTEQWPCMGKSLKDILFDIFINFYKRKPITGNTFNNFKHLVEALDPGREFILTHMSDIFFLETIGNIKEFVDKFKVSKDDILERYRMFITTIVFDKADVLEFLIEKYNLDHGESPENIKCTNRFCFKQAFINFGSLSQGDPTEKVENVCKIMRLLAKNLGICNAEPSLILDINKMYNSFSRVASRLLSNSCGAESNLVENTLKILIKGFNVSRDSFKELCNNEYYRNKIKHIKGGKRLSKYRKYEMWSNSLDKDY